MSLPTNSFCDASPLYRSRLKEVQQDKSFLDSAQRPFSVDAPTFRPGSNAVATIEKDALERPPPSPYYPLPVTAFLPPDTPRLPCPSTPPHGPHGTHESDQSGYRSHQRTSANESPAQVGDLFHGLGSIWANTPNKLSFAHNQASSSAALNGRHEVNDRSNIIDRSQSCSDAHQVSDTSDGAFYTAPNSRTSSKKESAMSSSSHGSAMVSPSPRRQLVFSQDANKREWHNSSQQVSNHAACGANANPSTITGRLEQLSMSPEDLQHSIIDAHPRLGSQTTSVGNWHVKNLVSMDLKGRETPGGVALPMEFSSPERGSPSSHIRTRGFGSPSTQQGLRGCGRNASKGSGSVSSDGQYRFQEYNQGHGLSPLTALEQQDPPRAPSAKDLAEYIKSGGLELAPQNARIAELPFRRGPAPMMTAHKNPGANSMNESALQNSVRPDSLVQQWKAKGGPTWNDVIENLAFVERARAAQPTNYGVIKLTDIPYTTTKPEVVAVIGEKAPMVQMPRGAGTYAIHIIMERGTAKSMDAYVEFSTPEAAQQVCARLEAHGRPMIQARRVTVNLSSQEALMKDLFPRAKCVRWDLSQPVILKTDDVWSSGFQGFVSSEELVMTVKVAQNPQRSRFAIKHQQRTYESMISLMFKYPWNAVDSYTLSERDYIFKAVRDQLAALSEKLRRDGSCPPVDAALLGELLDAGLKCPGFSESQRASLIDATEGGTPTRVYVTPIAHYWPFDVLGRKEGLTEEFVMYFISLLRSSNTAATASLAQLSAMNAKEGPRATNPHFGDFEIHWPRNKNEMTMAAAAAVEWDAVERALRKTVPDDAA